MLAAAIDLWARHSWSINLVWLGKAIRIDIYWKRSSAGAPKKKEKRRKSGSRNFGALIGQYRRQGSSGRDWFIPCDFPTGEPGKEVGRRRRTEGSTASRPHPSIDALNEVGNRRRRRRRSSRPIGASCRRRVASARGPADWWNAPVRMAGLAHSNPDRAAASRWIWSANNCRWPSLRTRPPPSLRSKLLLLREKESEIALRCVTIKRRKLAKASAGLPSFLNQQQLYTAPRYVSVPQGRWAPLSASLKFKRMLLRTCCCCCCLSLIPIRMMMMMMGPNRSRPRPVPIFKPRSWTGAPGKR